MTRKLTGDQCQGVLAQQRGLGGGQERDGLLRKRLGGGDDLRGRANMCRKRCVQAVTSARARTKKCVQVSAQHVQAVRGVLKRSAQPVPSLKTICSGERHGSHGGPAARQAAPAQRWCVYMCARLH